MKSRKDQVIEDLQICRPCNRLNTALNRLSRDDGTTMYTSAEVLWILQTVLEAESSGDTKKESYSNQDIAKLAHALDDICLTCKHRWGHETNEVRE